MSEDSKVEASAVRKPPNAGKGRVKGVPNKTTADVRNMLIASLDAVGGQAYLEKQAIDNPKAYLSLVSKVIPSEVKSQVTGSDGGPIQHAVKVKFGD
jgi:hypothetical protein